MSDNGWISVKDQLPVVGKEVLVFIRRDKDCISNLGLDRYYIDVDRYKGMGDFCYCKVTECVTHWQELPKFPKGCKNGR